ncbi:MAG TPA: 23S rRNA (adenine(2503)-C(2))-methyltransferase RlmN, partial [Thermoanaerobaculia bacterium]|nr:23S rRNA (adenine(2503)-C(2))-methyltransferase RlmN [Thermoanaerobaculia bacterium]
DQRHRSVLPQVDRHRPDPPPAPVSAAPDAGTAARTDVLGLPRAELAALLAPVVDRPYRVEQVYRGLYEQGAKSFDEMTALSRTLRAELAERFRIGLPAVESRHVSTDGTTKYLFRLVDGATVEAVDIPDGARRTFCISSQAGCAMACRFCVTGFWGAGRDLTAGEIVGQVLAIAGRLQAQQSLNLVFMGMGEPLLNLDAVGAAIDVLGEWISLRRITVSTVGLVPGIRRMAGWPRRPNLAVSLHAPDDERRSELMPVNRSWPLAELMAALREFPLEPNRKLTFEYLLIAGTNDAPADADALARLLAGSGLTTRAKVNLIPVNPDPVLGERMVPPPLEVVTAFRDRLRERGLVATVRRRRGDDVSAACGQLRAFGRDPRGFRRSNLSL